MGSLNRTVKMALVTLIGVAFVAPSSSMFATTHLIQFGGSFGLSYSPQSISVAVGDTIQWQGDFTSHPLSSTSVPAGAATFDNSAGTVFTYRVQFPGTYTYKCDIHAPSMSGSFSATSPTGVDKQKGGGQPAEFRLDQNYPNPFNPSTRIIYSLAQKSPVTLKLFNAIGEEVATLVKGVQESGTQSVYFDGAGLPSGVYLYRLEAGDFVATRRLVLVK